MVAIGSEEGPCDMGLGIVGPMGNERCSDYVYFSVTRPARGATEKGTGRLFAFSDTVSLPSVKDLSATLSYRITSRN